MIPHCTTRLLSHLPFLFPFLLFYFPPVHFSREEFMYLFIKFSYYSQFTMFYQFLLSSKVAQFYTYICIYACVYTYSFSHNIFHPVPSQVIGFSSLCYTAGPHCLSIPKCNRLHLLIPNSQSIPLPLLPPWQSQICSPCP